MKRYPQVYHQIYPLNNYIGNSLTTSSYSFKVLIQLWANAYVNWGEKYLILIIIDTKVWNCALRVFLLIWWKKLCNFQPTKWFITHTKYMWDFELLLWIQEIWWCSKFVGNMFQNFHLVLNKLLSKQFIALTRVKIQ
jgi:hypothetical protein